MPVEAGLARSPAVLVPPAVVNADVDASEFSEPTLAVLRDVAGIYDSETLFDFVRRLLARNRAPVDYAALKRELIDMRNAKVLVALDAQAASHETIVIPWGAMHMPGIEAGLRERGYRVESQHTRSVLRFEPIVAWLMTRGSA